MRIALNDLKEKNELLEKRKSQLDYCRKGGELSEMVAFKLRSDGMSQSPVDVRKEQKECSRSFSHRAHSTTMVLRQKKTS